MAIGYTRQSASSIVDGQTITASIFNNEFNAIVNAFHATTGHTHDGTTGGGAGINALVADAITFGTGVETDVVLTFFAASNSGLLSWMEDEDYFKFSDDILINTTEKLQFRDTAIYLNSSADGQLDLVADTTVAVTAPATTVSGTLGVTGASTLTGNTSVGGTLAVTGASTLTGNTSVGGTLDVTGASTLTGNTSVGGTLGVTGASTLTGNTAVGGTLAVTGASTLTGNTAVGGTLSIGGTEITACSSSPTDGATTTPISSDWAFDNVKEAVPTNAVFTDTVTQIKGGTSGTLVSGDITINSSGTATVSQSGNTITIGATGTTYSTATSSTAGLIKIGYTQTGKNYPVELSSEQAYVNVPWSDTNTTYTGGGNYGIEITAGNEIRLEDDRRRNSNTTDVYTGNTHDYVFFNADVGMSFYTSGNEEMRLEDDGDLHVDGNVIAYSTTISDKRLKSDITNISKALDKVGKINGVTFVRNHNGEKAAGIVAQEVMEVLPEAVKSQTLPLQTGEEDKEYYVVEYDAVTGLLVEAVKELKERIEVLESR